MEIRYLAKDLHLHVGFGSKRQREIWSFSATCSRDRIRVAALA